jgi:NAD(P)H dehydrogenase (quinone)
VKIGVTGATGRLGRLVIEQLLERCAAADIVAIVRDPGKAGEIAARGVEVRTANYDDPASLDAAVHGLDRLLLISSSEVGKRVPQHKNVIDAARAAGVKLVVYTSAPRATTSALLVAPEHKATEECLAASGVSFTVLRNNWYTENYAAQVQGACESGEVVAAAAGGRVASATRRDYAEGAAVVLTTDGHEGRTYELSGEHAWDFGELAATIAEVTGKACTYRPVTVDEMAGILSASGLDEGTAAAFAAIDGNIAEGDLGEASPDLASLIGRRTTPLKESVEQFVNRP